MKLLLLSLALLSIIYIVCNQPGVQAQAQPFPLIQGGAYPLAKTNRSIPAFFTRTSTKFNFTTSRSQCRAFCTRQDVRSWTSAQWTLYGQLWNEANRRGYWYDIQRMHALDCNFMVDNICAFHFDKAFHTWHRFYISHVEQTLQNIDRELNPGRAARSGEFCLGYWDWGYQDPFSNNLQDNIYRYIFSSNTTGTLISGLNNIPDGPFKNLRIPNTNTGNYTQRQPTPGNNTWNSASVSSCLSLRDAEANGNASAGFSPCIENNCHAGIHISIGGTMGNLQWSPGEPDFFLHHTMVDYLWWIWQHRRGSFYPTNPQWNDQIPQPYEQWQQNDAKDWSRFCFTYQPQGYVTQPSNYTKSTGIPINYNTLSQAYKDAIQRILGSGSPGQISRDAYTKFLSSHGNLQPSQIESLYQNYLGAVKVAQSNFRSLNNYYTNSTTATSLSLPSIIRLIGDIISSILGGSNNATQVIEYLNGGTGTDD